MTPDLLRRAGAECLGTCILVVIGDGATIVSVGTGPLTSLGVALLFGGCMFVLVALLGHRSNAYFNPAVTLLFALTRALFWRDVPLTLGSQLLGATCGALILHVLCAHMLAFGTMLPQSSLWMVLVLEMGLSMILLFIVLLTAQTSASHPLAPARLLAACLLGAIVALGTFLGGAFGGVLMNPSLTLGLVLVPSEWHRQRVHLLGPLLAACAVAGIYWGLRLREGHDLSDNELLLLAQEQPTASSSALPLQGNAWSVSADHVRVLQGTRRTVLVYDPWHEQPMGSAPSRASVK